MNIEQIAKEIWSEVSKSSSVGQSIAVIFAKALLKKLAEQADMKPAAYLKTWSSVDNSVADKKRVDLTEDSGPWLATNSFPKTEHLYTETQLLAAQQKAAEATWKAMTEGEDFFGASAAIAKATGGEA